MKVFYRIHNDAARREYVVRATFATGCFYCHVDDVNLDAAVRAALWDCGAAAAGSELTIPYWDGEKWGLWRRPWLAPQIYQDGDELIAAWYAAYQAALEAAIAARDKAREKAIAALSKYRESARPGTFVESPPFTNTLRDDEEYIAMYNSARSWCEEQRAIAAAREAAAEAAYQEEKHAFCTGPQASADLRQRYAAGYDCDLQYARERAAIEWPGYAVYPEKSLTWHYHHVGQPSAAALEEALRIGGEVVWMDHWNVTLPHGEVVMLPFLRKFKIFRTP